MFIQTEATPNPATLKFIPGKSVLSSGTADFRTQSEAADSSPLAARLFDIDGVEGVFLGSDFISVTKGSTEWQHLKPMILGAIMEHYMSGAPILKSDGANDGAGGNYAPEDEATVNTIKELLETRVRPAVAQDGGDITFSGFRDGIARFRRVVLSGRRAETLAIAGLLILAHPALRFEIDRAFEIGVICGEGAEVGEVKDQERRRHCRCHIGAAHRIPE